MDELCLFCGEKETIDHLFLRLFGFSNSGNSISFKAYLHQLFMLYNHSKVSEFAFIMWKLWFFRKKKLRNNVDISLVNICSSISSLWQDWCNTCEIQELAAAPSIGNVIHLHALHGNLGDSWD